MPVRVNFLLFRGGASLVAPVQPQDQSFGAHGRGGLGVSELSTPNPPLATHHSPQPPPPIAGQKGALLQCLYCITGASWPDCPLLGKIKKTKDQKVSPLTFPPPSPTTAQQCLNTSGDKNNLQKWSRNYIMNCPNTRHIVGFFVNQIFLRKLHFFFFFTTSKTTEK